MPALASITSGSITSKTYTARPSQAVFTTPGVTQWTVPAGVYSISAFMVSGGQGGGFGQTIDGFVFGGYGGQGGSTLWVEKIPVSPGSIVTVTVGQGGIPGVSNPPGGAGGQSGVTAGTRSCLVTNDGVTSVFAGAIWSRGIGGAGGVRDAAGAPGGGGGGAGGYGTAADPNTSANGGTGGGVPEFGSNPTAGGGGASGGTRGSSSFLGIKSGGSGGGVGLLGRGATAAVPVNFPAAGLGGSGGNNGVQVLQAGQWGGGGGGGGTGSNGGAGAQGAVRIVWGSTRFYPTSNVVDF